jgi:hypothetical protein
MKRKIDADCGRYQYSRRLVPVEPVFANIRPTRRLNRFSLRGQTKLHAQWLILYLVHNIGKVQHHEAQAMTRSMERARKVAYEEQPSRTVHRSNRRSLCENVVHYRPSPHCYSMKIAFFYRLVGTAGSIS